MRKDSSDCFMFVNSGFDSEIDNTNLLEEVMIDRNICTSFENGIVAIGTDVEIQSDFLPLLWRHEPRAVLFCSDSQPAALMVRQVERYSNDWRFPSPKVPIPPEIYASLSYWGFISLPSLICMVNRSDVCLSFEFDDIEDKLLLAPYRHEYGLDPGAAIRLQGDDEDCQWLQYLLFLQDHGIMPEDGHESVMSFEEYVEYKKTPEERLAEQYGFNMD